MGDLLFYADTSGMGAAVKASTGHYTHVAMVAKCEDNQVWIIDASRRYGVSMRPLAEDGDLHPDVYGLTIPYDTAAVLIRAMQLLGLPYDDAFLPDNRAFYCSELIYECYLDASGKHLFEAHPMNWRAADGSMPQYWVDHFRALNVPIPEGVLGTNPTDLARSPLLHKK